ncbi:hypothetical protein L1987_63054 [Smallanthus sonchifolius]|uniref:Uncharacterized protein n=1 Tax=Smallanthus sonchifolius TaxID=185202 RepID=A0ACB9CCJ0_9ASTR|nr:hypothetical protein L1987_63054 [Smallanthus sonchifolius]
MRDSNLDLFDPITAVMQSDYLPEDCRGHGDFAFAFNDRNFSDRVLRIEIVSEPLESAPDGEGCTSLADWDRNRKRRREDIKKENGVDVAVGYPEQQVFNQPEHLPDDVDTENQDEEPAAMVEESLSDDNDLNWTMECSTVVRVKTLHISSPILAARSPYFYKLFSNGMRETEHRHVSLRINASEEDALMELLNFIYSNNLTVTTASELLDVLMAADKFEVASCMRYCSHLLRNLPMTPESALLYLDLPSRILRAEAVQPLTVAAKQFLAVRYKDITKYQDEEKGSVSFPVDYEFAARSKPGEEFVSKYKGTYIFTGGKAVGYRNLFAIPWTSFVGEDSVYFINGVLHLRAELTIRH